MPAYGALLQHAVGCFKHGGIARSKGPASVAARRQAPVEVCWAPVDAEMGQGPAGSAVNIRRPASVWVPDVIRIPSAEEAGLFRCIPAFVDHGIPADRAENGVLRQIFIAADGTEFKLSCFPQAHHRLGEEAVIPVFIFMCLSASRAVQRFGSPSGMAYPAVPSGAMRNVFRKGVQLGIDLLPDLKLRRQLGEPSFRGAPG